jgi:ABC-type Fe2+-enterobactin transport system substrate-binding protein
LTTSSAVSDAKFGDGDVFILKWNKVTTAWRVLRLWIVEIASIYRG